MPSELQLRWEAFADKVDKATHSAILKLFSTQATEQVNVRVETVEGHTIECRLSLVDLDRRELIGLIPQGGALRVPLERVKSVWHKRRRKGRALSLWFATLASGTLAGFLIAPAASLGAAAGGATLGALLGSLAGVAVLVGTDQWEALYDWVPLFESTPPA